ncbi:hypothetical protein SSBR45G_22290 [Bradyrhizobium sp. SSBR45G]|uniref:DUF1223 domain-containing protein n=1 Tax=unclassified Bradyrhizobium TaxID=2631580 RepID=UPI002342A2AE|nr:MULTISPECIES: DUF1223 domain-containing protein [unclassified Bradyrhizobium]GLH77321.1 hypothetical protein SSBR45G_22290 [Bradyrhizobium sp. SSBR45G]GLH84573.1 hypothetical protein SSBR45R_20330 [Bradyrhizobium sp. SSBR45R]
MPVTLAPLRHAFQFAMLLASFAPWSPSAAAVERPVVIELFTSQGCSSCPPANAYLNEMVRDRRDVLPLAFHVTYWDRLGWKDPFSLSAATDRQARYGSRFGDGSYTPEIVVDGVTGHVGSNRSEVGSAIDRARGASATAATIRLARAGDKLTVEVGGGEGRGRVVLVGFDRRHETAIRRGENGGRTLEELNVVRSVRALGDWSGSALRLSEPMPEGEDAAVILEAPDGRIVGAGRL